MIFVYIDNKFKSVYNKLKFYINLILEINTCWILRMHIATLTKLIAMHNLFIHARIATV